MGMFDFVDGEGLTAALVGKTVRSIHWSEEALVFDTDAGLVGFTVYGDCCSYSLFNDIYGVEHLLNNGPIIAAETVELAEDDVRYPREKEYESIEYYGYRLTTVHPTFGEVSSVFSFRNESNGYYGGWMNRMANPSIPEDAKQITADVVA